MSPISDRAWLAAICASELGTLMVFSSFSALLPILRKEWGMSATEAGLVVGFYQVGYIGAVTILSTLTDYLPPRRIYLLSALWTFVTALAFPLLADGFLSALILRTLVGLGLAGTYMPGMRMVAERFARGGRGFAMGCYIAAFTVGTSVSLIVTAQAHARWGWRWAFAVTALGPLAAAIIGWRVLPMGQAPGSPHGGRTGAISGPPQGPGAGRAPDTVVRAGGSAGAISGPPQMKNPGTAWQALAPVLRNTAALRLIAAYAGHTWELMGMRGWIVPFFTASLVAAGAGLEEAAARAAWAGSAVLAIGALPHPFSGLLSDRLGRAPLISSFMLLSGACSLLMGWALHWSFAPLLALGLLYGILVTAESAVISTGVADVAEPAYLGRTMALQSMTGFTGGALGPIAFGVVLDWAPRLGASADAAWAWAFSALAAGAFVGPLAVGLREFSHRPAQV